MWSVGECAQCQLLSVHIVHVTIADYSSQSQSGSDCSVMFRTPGGRGQSLLPMPLEPFLTPWAVSHVKLTLYYSWPHVFYPTCPNFHPLICLLTFTKNELMSPYFCCYFALISLPEELSIISHIFSMFFCWSCCSSDAHCSPISAHSWLTHF